MEFLIGYYIGALVAFLTYYALDRRDRKKERKNSVELINAFCNEHRKSCRALWLARAERAKVKYHFLRYMWLKLNQMQKPDKPLIESIRKDFSKWANVERRCREYAKKFEDKEGK